MPHGVEVDVSRINYTVEQLRDKATVVRRNIMSMCAGGEWGGCGTALAGADLLTTLFFYEINLDLENPSWAERDIWHSSSRPLAPALYAAMAEVGFFPRADLLKLGEFGHYMQAFPSASTPGIEVSGIQGSGLSTCVGVGLASRIDDSHRRVYCIMDDSEVHCGQFWEAALAAAHHELDNLVLIIDYDGKQQDGDIEEVMAIAPLTEKLRSFNWHTIEVDGNDVQQIVEAFDRSRSLRGAPVTIFSCTTVGHGISFMEDDDAWLEGIPDEAQIQAALAELGTSGEEWQKHLV